VNSKIVSLEQRLAKALDQQTAGGASKDESQSYSQLPDWLPTPTPEGVSPLS
jgi:hypothetical protein